MKRIPLTQGKFALVDDADFDWLNQWKWFAYERWDKRCWYAGRMAAFPNGKRGILSMHRAILPQAVQADHWDGDGLNNQRQNLRDSSGSQNQGNARKRRDNTSGFKGVRLHQSNRWEPRVRQRSLGLFDTAEAAARAYDAEAKKEFGEFARLNFPEKQQTQTTN